MSASGNGPRSPRLEELLAARALGGLDALERAELEATRTSADDALVEELELAAAALDLAWRGADEPLPADLRQRLVSAGDAWQRARRPGVAGSGNALQTQPAIVPEAPRAHAMQLAGWVLAAAATVFAVLGWLARPGSDLPDPDSAYAALRGAPGTSNPAWQATEHAPGASGDVAWSQDEQRGFLHILGLQPNDPRVEQYQLWILDAAQEHPIDGGVFDVRGGEVVIPIDVKLPVQRPTAFAVTVERPGGVVISKQERVVLLASLQG